MGKLTKSFTDEFARASRRCGTFENGHAAQIDALQAIVDEINADGVFRAEITSLTGVSVPVLEITHKANGYGQGFFIEFGHDTFGGGAVLGFSTGAGRTPLGGEPAVYDLQNDRERDRLLTLVGEALAKKVSLHQSGAAAVTYIKGKKTSFQPN